MNQPPHRSVSPYPPLTVAGVGSASPTITNHPSVKHVQALWKTAGLIGAILATGAAGGMWFSTTTARYLTAESLKPTQDTLADIGRSLRAIEATQAQQTTDIAVIKNTLRLMPTDPIAIRPR